MISGMFPPPRLACTEFQFNSTVVFDFLCVRNSPWVEIFPIVASLDFRVYSSLVFHVRLWLTYGNKPPPSNRICTGREDTEPNTRSPKRYDNVVD